MVNTPAVTFHGHDTEAGNNAGTNYHAHTASNEIATFTHPTTTQPTHTETIQQQPHSTMMQTGETSSRRNSYGDDAVINKTTQLYAATPRSTCDSAVIYISYALGVLGFLVGLTWLIVLLITQGQDYEPFLQRNYDIALKPFLMQLPYFMAATSFLLMAGKRNTTLAWFLFTVSNFCIVMFWLILIVPYFIQFAYSSDSTGGTGCPDITSDPVLVGGINDTTELCRLRKSAAALSCAFVAIHFVWFCMGLIQTIRHWKTIIVLDAAYPSKQIWLLLLTIEACGLIIWAAGNLRLTYLGKNDVALWSNQILWTSTYIVTLVTIVVMVMTAYAILDATKLYVGITFLFHLCAMMLLWSVFVYEARWADDPSIGLGDDGLGNAASGINTNNKRANKVVAAGLGIVAGVETIFTVLFAIAYKMMPDLFLTQPNLTGPAAV